MLKMKNERKNEIKTEKNENIQLKKLTSKYN